MSNATARGVGNRVTDWALVAVRSLHQGTTDELRRLLAELVATSDAGGYGILAMKRWQSQTGMNLGDIRQAVEQELSAPDLRRSLERFPIDQIPSIGFHLDDDSIYLHQVLLNGDGVRLEPMGAPIR